MAHKKSSNAQTGDLAKIEQKQKRQQRLINNMEKRESWMKWVIIGLIVLVLLLILFLGYATDWTKGLNKDTTTNGTGTSLDSAGGLGDEAAGANGAGTGTNGSNGTNGSTGTNTSNAAKESANTSTTTNNSTTTTNNTTTTPTGPSDDLSSLYLQTSAGDNISRLLDAASSTTGVDVSCHNELVIQVCEFTDSTNSTITTKNLLGTGVITSVVKDF